MQSKKSGRIAVTLATFYLTAAAHAGCVVSRFIQSKPQPFPKTVAIQKAAQSPGYGGVSPKAVTPGARQAVDPSATPEMKRARSITQAIGMRNVSAFRQLMPADPSQRLKLLREREILVTAASASSLTIIRQILSWHPELVNMPQTRNQFSGAIESIARGWQSRDIRPNPPELPEVVESIELLLNWGASPDGRPIGPSQVGDWQSPLSVMATIASSSELGRAAELLLLHGASILSKNGNREYEPLLVASQRRNPVVVAAILKHRKLSQEQLDEALVNTPIEETNAVLPLLLEGGANVNMDGSRFKREFSPMAGAAVRLKDDGERDLVKLLIRYKADPNRHGTGDSPLMNVIHDPDLVQALLDLGANPNYRDAHKRYTALMMAGPGDGRSIQLIAARGGKVVVDSAVIAGSTVEGVPLGPVSWALSRGNDALAVTLLARDGLGRDDCGAPYYAGQAGAVRTLAGLLERGVDINAVIDDESRTPLVVAAASGQVEAVKFLLDRRVAKVDDTTPVRLHWVSAGGHPRSPIPEPKLVGGETALAVAVSNGHVGVVRELLWRGAHATRRDRLGLTALDYVRGENANEISNLLKARK